MGAGTSPLFDGQIFTGPGKIFIGVGPYVGYGLDAKQSPGDIDLYQKDKAIMHHWDFGLLSGG